MKQEQFVTRHQHEWRQFEDWLEDTVTGSSHAPVAGIGLASLAVNF